MIFNTSSSPFFYLSKDCRLCCNFFVSCLILIEQSLDSFTFTVCVSICIQFIGQSRSDERVLIISFKMFLRTSVTAGSSHLLYRRESYYYSKHFEHLVLAIAMLVRNDQSILLITFNTHSGKKCFNDERNYTYIMHRFYIAMNVSSLENLLRQV